jgi:hypothetical protein
VVERRYAALFALERCPLSVTEFIDCFDDASVDMTAQRRQECTAVNAASQLAEAALGRVESP